MSYAWQQHFSMAAALQQNLMLAFAAALDKCKAWLIGGDWLTDWLTASIECCWENLCTYWLRSY
jgi:hypothetical protein